MSVVEENSPDPAHGAGELTMQVRGLTAAYGQIEVLRGLDFDVPTGKVVVVLGANGSGKTTTLRALTGGMGFFKPGGSVLLNGEEVVNKDAADIVRRGVAHVPQGRGTFPELSVNDNMLAGAYVRNDDKIAEDLERYYELFPVLGERRSQVAGSLSGGEQQMLAVARALMSRPTMMLLDEPSLGLAPLIIQNLFRTFRQLNEDLGTTILLVEQNAKQALDISQYGYVLEAGAIVLEGPSEELRNDPAVQEAYLG